MKWYCMTWVCIAFGGISYASELPEGIMLNLDFENASEGLIPSKTPYSLHVPQQELGIEYFNNRHMLIFDEGQGLDIPHSSLLDPAGDEWIVSVRVYALTDGLVFSQANDTHGLVIYMKDGHIAAAMRSGLSTVVLAESEHRGRTKYTKRWVTIELRIKKDMAVLSLNRKRAAMVMDQPALDGENLRIRIGSHQNLPQLLKNISDAPSTDFTGAISSLKILRQ